MGESRIRHIIDGMPVYSILHNRRDYGYYCWLVDKKGIAPKEALRISKKTSGAERRYLSHNYKYQIDGKLVKHLLNDSHRDYNYFLLLLKKGMSIKVAYERTVNSINKHPRDISPAKNRKYFYNGVSIRDIFKERNDQIIFYHYKCTKKMTVKDAVQATITAIKARNARWKKYLKEKSKAI